MWMQGKRKMVDPTIALIVVKYPGRIRILPSVPTHSNKPPPTAILTKLDRFGRGYTQRINMLDTEE